MAAAPNAEAPGQTPRHRPHALAAALFLGVALALILYLHGTLWWIAPLALVGVVLAHLLVLGAIVVVGRRVTGAERRPASATHGGSMLLHRPRQYDALAGFISLGREGKMRRWMLDLGALRNGSAVLDVGCGTGTLLVAAAERVGPAGVLCGVEPATEMAARAREKAATEEVVAEVVESSADRLPFEPASFDAVFCTLVLHHLPESMRHAAIREMRRVLRPGGRLVLVDWQRPTSLLRALTSALFVIHLLHGAGHRRSPLDDPDLEPLMEGLGFQDVARSAFGAGGVIGAVVGRLGAETATD